MRALVSGASGFVGRALQARLRAEGWDVARIVRASPGPGEVGLDLARRRLDLAGLDDGRLADVDAVFHLAGEPITPTRWSPAKRERIRASRVVSTDVLARALAASEARRTAFVCASAIGFYGDRGDEVLDESSAAGTGFLAEVCRAWEAAAAPAREAGIRVVNARLGVVLGPDGGALARLVPLFSLGLGARLGSGRQWTSFVSLHDAVGALVHLATRPDLAGPVNVTAPEPARNAELTAALAAALHRRSVLAVPRGLLVLALGRDVARDVALASQRVLPRRLEADGFAFAHRDVASAVEAALAQRRRRRGRRDG
ncbi:MAG TPA: TIGR01777 family oxidoreductase [Acidimicrobiales bacterium]|nr:TIGR01777 family oxidoreductase [Acidimicrobiales bacterium]